VGLIGPSWRVFRRFAPAEKAAKFSYLGGHVSCSQTQSDYQEDVSKA
jgi:hypothetical protein